MNFESAAAEGEFKRHFHARRVVQDQCFAVAQAAIVWLLALRAGGADAAAPPAVRLLLWGARALSAAILGLSLLSRRRYAAARPYLLGAARAFYGALWPQLVWHLASAARAPPGRGTWAGLFLLWVTWTRWGGELLLRECRGRGRRAAARACASPLPARVYSTPSPACLGPPPVCPRRGGLPAAL